MTAVERIEWRLRNDSVAEEWWPVGTLAREIRARRASAARQPAASSHAPGTEFYERTLERRPRLAGPAARLLPSFATFVAVIAIVGSLLLVREWAIDNGATPAPSPTTLPSPTPNLALDRIRAAGVIRIAVVGGPASVHGQVAREVADQLGVPNQLFDASRADIGAGQWYGTYDLAVGMARSSTFFEHVYNFGDYALRPAYLVVPAGSDIAAPADIVGQVVCVREQSDTELWIAGFREELIPEGTTVDIPIPPDFTLVTMASGAECLAEVDAGRADAVFADELGPDVIGDSSYRTVGGGPIFVERLVFAMPIFEAEGVQLIQPVDDIVAELRFDDTLARILAEPAADGTSSEVPDAWQGGGLPG